MAKVAKIALLFAVYLMWICGNPAIALSCHANEAQHTHCCKSCECHHEGSEKIHVETPHSCHHDHSNTIVLYDTTKRLGISIEPAELDITDKCNIELDIDHIFIKRISLHYERKVPLQPAPSLSRRGLRAPPVIA
jgi:hypothetical protein